MKTLPLFAALLTLSAAAQAKSPCEENPELSKNGFVFQLKAPNGKSADQVSFIYASCRVEDMDTVENRPTVPRAVRIFHADQAGWQLWVETVEGASKSYLTLIEDYGGSGPKNAAWFGEYANAELLTKTVDLGKVSIRDTRAGANKVWTGTANIRSAPFSKPDGGKLTGCQ